MQVPPKPYMYSSVINDILVNGLIDPEEPPYIYFNDRLRQVYDRLFLFAQTNLSEVCRDDDYRIEPARFYYLDLPDVNAGAYPRENGYFRIAVNRGTIEELWDKFAENAILDDPELAEFKALNDFYEAEPHKVSISFLMFQCATLFTFYHELGHLVQFSNYERTMGAADLQLKEKYVAVEEDEFDFMYHILEYDADLHGGNEVAAHVNDFFLKLPAKDQTNENLRKLIIIALVGVLGFYMMLLNNPNEPIYFYEQTHPHPLIRLQWIQLSLIDRLKISYPQIQDLDVIDEALRVLDIYFRHKNMGSILNHYHVPLRENAQAIRDYIITVYRTANSPGYEFLASNTIHRGIRL